MICKLTNKDFQIKVEDLSFYKKISPKINNQIFLLPNPTLSPEGRLMRRMSWRNDRSFYKRLCDYSKQSMISIYPEKTEFPVYHPDAWWGDSWDAKDFGLEINFNKPFFEQWAELLKRVPRKGIDIVNCENSYYCNYCGDDKNCYLDIAGEANEDCYFNLFTKYSKNCVDCTFVYNSELTYDSISCYRCHDVICGYYLENCTNCAFSFDLKSCNNCLFCSNLRHKKYHIYNQPVTKAQYEFALAQLALNTTSGLDQAKKIWKQVIADAVHRDMYVLNSENCTGNDIENSKNCHHCFNVSNSEDCKYLYDVLDAKDCYDLNYSLYHPEASYELISTLNMKYSAFCMASHYCHSSYYCDQCENSENLFGCIGIKKGKYCILNKQYSKGDYEKLLAKLISHMQETKEWGEFFPYTLSPWGYNETVAYEYYPLQKDFALEKGFNWTNKTFTKEFKLIKQEQEFYSKINVATPVISPQERHLERLAMRNPRQLYARTCSISGKPIISSYHSDEKVKVYCEEQYLMLF